MVRNHTKRITAPTTWTVEQKKGVKWIAGVNPGAHPAEHGMPLVLVLRELLHHAKTTREVKQILQAQQVLVDGVRRKDHSFNIGLMDVLSLPALKENYRISLSKNRRLNVVKIDDKEAKEKICKIQGKGLCKGKTQLRLSDGRTVLVDKDTFKTTDSVVISVPDQKIISHLSFEKGASVLLTGGKKIGIIGTVENISSNVVTIKADKQTFETLKKYCYVVGKNKPTLTIE